MHVSARHFMVHAYTPSVTANHHMLGIQIPSYTRAGHTRQNGQAEACFTWGQAGRCHLVRTQPDLNSTKKYI